MSDLLCNNSADHICVHSVRRDVLHINNSQGREPDRRETSAVRPRPSCVPFHRTIVAVDIVGSTTRTNPARSRLRHQMYNLLTEALRASGIAERHHDPPTDRGDGTVMLIHPCDHVPKTLLLGIFITTLHQLLIDYNSQHADQGFQLRVAVHAGEVHYDQWGHFGEALDIACRLLDAPELKRMFAATSAPLALVVSDDIHRSIIRHRYDACYNDFKPIVRIEIGGLTFQGWVHMQQMNPPVH